MVARLVGAARPACCPRVTLGRCLHAELLKLRGSRMIPVHLAIALGVPLVFVLYYASSPTLAHGAKLTAFVEIVACGMTFVAGLIAGFAAEDEWGATRLQAVLGAPSRIRAAAAKLLVYLGLALVCLALALGVFVGGMGLAGQSVGEAGRLVAQFGLIFLGSVPSYVLAFWASLAWGRNAGFGLGILGVLVALLLLTGLGDGIWPLVGWAWPERLAVMLPDALRIAGGVPPEVLAGLDAQAAADASARFLGIYLLGCALCATSTVVLAGLAALWLARTDGRRAGL